MKKTLLFISVSLLFIMCDSNKSSVNTVSKNNFDLVEDDINKQAQDIFSCIKLENYDCFSNNITSLDSIITFVKNLSIRDTAEVTKDELINVVSKNYPDIIKKIRYAFINTVAAGKKQGIIWKDAEYFYSEYTLKFGQISKDLSLTIYFKYKGVKHSIDFSSNAFSLIGSKWALVKSFDLDDGQYRYEAEDSPSADSTVSADSIP